MLIYFQAEIIPPITIIQTVQYPELMKIYFQDFLSYKALVAISGKIKNNPIINPCKAPCPKGLILF
jgi:hypothetical protein